VYPNFEVSGVEYSVQKLSRLAGISPRTIRYYDQMGLLKPARINSSGYRLYGQTEVNRLQQILFYRELGMGLETIKEVINSSSFNELKAFREHRSKLLQKKEQLESLIVNIEKTIASYEGGITMSDQEKFEGFKKKMIQENEEAYGEEIRQKYGDDVVNQSNQKFQGMKPEEYEEMTRLSAKITEKLEAAFQTGDPGSGFAQEAADLHRRWLSYFWKEYSKEAHAGLGQMYVDDPRFTAYYDKNQPGTAAFLRDAILIYTGMKE
jgi:DNA-binding transcriptional MerR regulator